MNAMERNDVLGVRSPMSLKPIITWSGWIGRNENTTILVVSKATRPASVLWKYAIALPSLSPVQPLLFFFFFLVDVLAASG